MGILTDVMGRFAPSTATPQLAAPMGGMMHPSIMAQLAQMAPGAQPTTPIGGAWGQFQKANAAQGADLDQSHNDALSMAQRIAASQRQRMIQESMRNPMAPQPGETGGISGTAFATGKVGRHA